MDEAARDVGSSELFGVGVADWACQVGLGWWALVEGPVGRCRLECSA